MSIFRRAGTAAAISVAGAGIAVGGIGLAAADGTSNQDSTTQVNPSAVSGSTTGSALPAEGRGHNHGPGDREGPGELAAQLAEALGLPESDVTAALQTVREQLAPEASEGHEKRTSPSAADREADRAAMVSALANELGVSEQQVTDALDSLSADRTAQARSALADRLDAAVADGGLTSADEQSVLKAFDAGVLGGQRHGAHGPRGAEEGADEGAATS